jgi:hypothetical protein
MDHGSFRDFSLQQILDIAKGYSDAYEKEHFGQLDSERMSYLFKRNSSELKLIVEELFNEFQNSDFIPIGVVIPLIPKILAEILSDIKSFALSGIFPNRSLLIGFNSLANLLESPVFSSRAKSPIQTAYTTTSFKVKSSAFCPPVIIVDKSPSGLKNNSKTEEMSITSPKIIFIT